MNTQLYHASKTLIVNMLYFCKQFKVIGQDSLKSGKKEKMLISRYTPYVPSDMITIC